MQRINIFAIIRRPSYTCVAAMEAYFFLKNNNKGQASVLTVSFQISPLSNPMYVQSQVATQNHKGIQGEN